VKQDYTELLPESFFALMGDLHIPLPLVSMITNIEKKIEDLLLPSWVKRYLGFTQIAYAEKLDTRGF
jgi:hypothetical protein